MTSTEHQQPHTFDWTAALEWLGASIRSKIIEARDQGQELSRPVAQEGGDTIFAIDRHVEPVIEETVAHWVAQSPNTSITLIAEGLGHTGEKHFGPSHATHRYRVLMDPIDGTRNIMYDKRSAWFLAAVMPDHGEHTRLNHAIASVILELPPSKQFAADTFLATHNAPTQGRRVYLYRQQIQSLPVRPSKADSLLGGFGQVSNFFPGTKMLASELMERIVKTTLGDIEPGSAAVFEDQYISTGGQLVELIMGRDRFCCDLRPLFYRILEQQTGRTIRGLECHPYDMAGALTATQAGVVLTNGFGQPLDLPLDVHTPVHWCGYANKTLQQAIEPVILRWLHEKGLQI